MPNEETGSSARTRRHQEIGSEPEPDMGYRTARGGWILGALPADQRQLDARILMSINTEWHAAHPMPARACLSDRVKWHVAHAEQCGCRPIPKSVQRELQRLEGTPTTPLASGAR